MRYQFKQAVHIGGRDFPVGIHEVPEEVENHLYFLQLVGAGMVIDPDDAKAISTETVEERNRRLLDRLTSQSKTVHNRQRVATTAEGIEVQMEPQRRPAPPRPSNEPPTERISTHLDARATAPTDRNVGTPASDEQKGQAGAAPRTGATPATASLPPGSPPPTTVPPDEDADGDNDSDGDRRGKKSRRG